MSRVQTGSRVAVVDGGAVCLGEVTGIEDGMVDVDFDDGDDGTYPIADVSPGDSARLKLVECERELRKYVKQSGGFRKDLSEEDVAKAKELMVTLGRIDPRWDENIIIPGF